MKAIRQLYLLAALALSGLLCLFSTLPVGVAYADTAIDPCTGFKWDLRREVALFRGEVRPIDAAATVEALPTIEADHLYRVRLAAQEQVRFAAAPAKRMLTDGAHAGLARFHSGLTAHYRVALSVPAWLDVVAGTAPVRSVDFGGSAGCTRPHKVVEFELAADTDYVVQLSGTAETDVDLTITAIPAGH